MSMKLKSLALCLLLAASCLAPVQAAAPQSNKDIVVAVSYTHLDVYKRQV